MQGRYTLIATALLCLLTCAAAAQDRDGYDFRKTRWGMSPAQVKASEGSEPTSEGPYNIYQLLVYPGSVAGLEVKYGFFFLKNKLVQTSYIFQNSYTNKNQYILDYVKLKEILTRKYGAPSADKIVWSNELFRDDVENYGTAVTVGHLVYQSDWETPATDIRLTLKGGNFNVTLGIVYIDRKSKALMKSIQDKQEEKDF